MSSSGASRPASGVSDIVAEGDAVVATSLTIPTTPGQYYYAGHVLAHDKFSDTYAIQFESGMREAGLMRQQFVLEGEPVPGVEPEQDMPCVICCGGGDVEGTSVCCGSCGCWTHTKCYGHFAIPPGDEEWYCQRCAFERSLHKKRRTDPASWGCIACGLKGSEECVFVRVEAGAAQLSGRDWIHVCCAMINGIWIEWSPDPTQPGGRAHGFSSNLAYQHFRLRCMLCKSPTGASVQCAMTKWDHELDQHSPANEFVTAAQALPSHAVSSKRGGAGGALPSTSPLSSSASPLPSPHAASELSHVSSEATEALAPALEAAVRTLCDGSCMRAFHVTCARRAGLRFSFLEADLYLTSPAYKRKTYAFCTGHTAKFALLLSALQGWQIPPNSTSARALDRVVPQPTKAQYWKDKLVDTPDDWVLSLRKQAARNASAAAGAAAAGAAAEGEEDAAVAASAGEKRGAAGSPARSAGFPARSTDPYSASPAGAASKRPKAPKSDLGALGSGAPVDYAAANPRAFELAAARTSAVLQSRLQAALPPPAAGSRSQSASTVQLSALMESEPGAGVEEEEEEGAPVEEKQEDGGEADEDARAPFVLPQDSSVPPPGSSSELQASAGSSGGEALRVLARSLGAAEGCCCCARMTAMLLPGASSAIAASPSAASTTSSKQLFLFPGAQLRQVQEETPACACPTYESTLRGLQHAADLTDGTDAARREAAWAAERAAFDWLSTELGSCCSIASSLSPEARARLLQSVLQGLSTAAGACRCAGEGCGAVGRGAAGQSGSSAASSSPPVSASGLVRVVAAALGVPGLVSLVNEQLLLPQELVSRALQHWDSSTTSQ